MTLPVVQLFTQREEKYRPFRRLMLVLVVLSLAIWQQDSGLKPARAQSRGRVPLSAARQIDTSYEGSPRALASMGAGPSALSMAAGDLDGDAIGDLAIGFTAPRGGVIAIHHGNLDAYAPQSQATFQAMSRGQYPAPYLPQADLVEVPVRPDFLAQGDLIGLKGSALAAAAQGGSSIAVLSRDGTGAMTVQQTVTVTGSITAMAAHNLTRGKYASVAVGVHTDSGSKLLVYSGSAQGLALTGSFALASDASSFASGDLDGDGIPDLLAVAGGQISILHSASQSLEPLSTSFTVTRATLGRFVQDRSPIQQMALLASDGNLHIMGRRGLDSTPYTSGEIQTLRSARIAARLNPDPASSPAAPPAQQPVTWNELETRAGAASGNAPFLLRGRVSNSISDDVMVMSSARISVLAHPTAQPNQSDMQDRSDLGADAVAAIAVRVGADSRSGIVYITKGQRFPSVISTQSTNTFIVNTTTDLVASDTSACLNSVTGQCSLREAIIEANQGSGTDTIMIPNGTYTLTLARAVSPLYDAQTGSLDVTKNVNIIGSGQTTTIIQGGTQGVNDSGGPNGVDKVFSFNQNIGGSLSDASVSVSGLTIQNGFNRGGRTAGDGWGGAFDFDTGSSGNATLTLTNVTVSNNTLLEGEGGGFAIFNTVTTGNGKASAVNCVIQNNVSQVSSSGVLGGGGGIAVETAASLTMTNTLVTGNRANQQLNGIITANGAGIEDAGSGYDSNGLNFVNNQVTLHGVTLSNNTASGRGGGLDSVGGGLIIDQESLITGNIAHGDGAGIWAGIYSNSSFPSYSVMFSNISVVGNQSTGLGGGIKISGGLNGATGFQMHYSRIALNTAASQGGQQFSWRGIAGATIDTIENWWATNTDPILGSNPQIVLDTNGATAGTMNYIPYIVLGITAAPTNVQFNATSALTADVAHDSAGSADALTGHLDVFTNLPVSFSSAPGGSIATSQPVDFPGLGTGMVNSTFQAGGAPASVPVSATFDNVVATTTIEIVGPPTMTLGFSPSSVAVNASSTLTFTLNNANAAAIDGSFTDNLPAHMQVASSPSVSNTCGGSVGANAGASSIAWSNGYLAVGVCTIKVNVIATVDNTYTDTVTLDSTAAGNATAASATLTVINPPSMTKSFSPNSIAPGGVSTVTLGLSNPNTNLTLNSVQFTDTLPTGMTVASPANLSSTCSGTAAQSGGAVSLTGATMAPGANCTVTVSVTSSTVGVATNSVTPSASNSGIGAAATATANLTVGTPPSISKAFGTGSIAQNGSTSLSFTVHNNDSGAAQTGIAFADNFPTGLAIVSPNGLTGSCGAGTITATAGSTSVTLAGATLGAGASCTFSVNVTATAAGTLTNTTSAVTSTEGGSGLPATAALSVEGPPSIAKAFAAGTIAQNTSTNLTFTITNPAGNPAALTGVAFTDTLPTGLTVAGATSTQCGGTLTVTAPTSIQLSGATVAVGTPCTFIVSVTGATAGSYTNTTGSVTSANGGTGNTASANLVVGTGPSTIKSFNPASVVPGGNSTLTIAITNPNASLALSGVAFTDTLPSGMVLASSPTATNSCNGTLTATGGASSLSLSNGSISSGGSCAVTVIVVGNTVGALVNSVSSTSTNGGTGNTSSATLTVVSAPTISKSFGAASVALNGSTSLSFTIQNNNAGTALHGVGFTDSFPSGLAVSSPNGLTGSCGGGTITAIAGSGAVSLSGATLTAGTSCTFAVNVTGSSAGALTNTTSAVTSTEGGNGLTASASLSVEAPPSLAKSFSDASIVTGASTNLTFTVTNPAGNPASLTSVAFTDTLPSGLSVTTGTSSQCGGTLTVTAAVSIQLSGATVAVGTPCTFTIAVTGSTPGSYTNITGNVTSANGGTGNTATATLTVGTGPSATKSFNPTSVPQGGSSTLTIAIVNPNAGLALTGVAFTDTLPSGMVLASNPASTNTCGGTLTATGGAGSLSLSGGSIASSASCSVTVAVQGNTVGALTNSVSVTSTNGGAGNTTSAILTVVAPPTMSKAFGAPSIALNAGTTLSFTIQNSNSGAALHAVGFSDTFPAGLAVAAPNGLSGSCGGGTITATAGSTSVSLSGATLAAGASCLFSVNVTATLAGSLTNTTSVVSSTEGGNGTVASASLSVEAPPSIAKAFTDASIVTGASTTLTFTITNPAGNPAALTGVGVNDPLPSGLTVVSGTSSPCGGALTLTAPASIQLTGASVAVGTPCTFSVTVTGATAGNYTNVTGSVISTNGGSGNTASANLTVGAGPVATKSFNPTSIALGGTSTLTIGITNPNSTLALTGVAFTDTLPSGMTLAASPGSSNTCGGSLFATGGSGSLSLSGGSLAAAASCSVSVTVQGNSAGTLSNSVQVTSTNGGTGNTPTATLTVSAGPVATKSFNPTSIALGGTSTMTIGITNPNSTAALTGVAFTDTLPSGMTLAAAPGAANTCGGSLVATGSSGSLSLSGGSIAASSSCSVSVTVQGNTPGALSNSVQVTSTSGGTGNTPTATLTVSAGPVATKSFNPTSIVLGGTSTMTIGITNPNSTAALTGVAFTDTLPSGMTLAAVPGAANTCGGSLVATGSSGSLSLSGGSIAASSSCSVSVTVQGNTPGALSNSVQVTSTSGGTGNTPTATLTVSAGPVATKSFNPTSIALGGTSTMTIGITNPNSTAALTGVAFTDTLPSGMTLAAAPGAANTCGGSLVATGSSGSLSLSGGSIAASASCSVSVTVQGNTPGALSNSVQVTSTSGGTGNTPTATLTVSAGPVATKSFNPTSIALGGTSTMTIGITNPNSTAALTGVAFTDTLPSGMTLAAAPGATNTCGGSLVATASSGSLSLSGGSIAASSSCSVSVTVQGNTAGALSNSVQVTSTSGGTGNTPTATLTVEAPPSLAKAFTDSSILTGATTTLTFTVTNPAGNPASLTGVAFSDILPTGLTVAASSASVCGGTATVTAPTTIQLTNATVAVGTPCTFSVTVTGASPGTYTNTTGNVTSANGGTGNTASAGLNVTSGGGGGGTTITNVTSTTANGTYGAGTVIPIQVTFSNTVTVTGTPTLSLNSGAGGTAAYTSGSGTSTLTFTYTVAPGDTTNGGNLDAASGSALSLSGGTIVDGTSSPATLTVPVAASTGSLATNKAIIIDTGGPHVVSFSVLFGTSSYNLTGSSRVRVPWEITGIQVVFDRTITQANANSLTGVSATGFSGLGTTTLTWSINAVDVATLSTMLAGSGPNAILDGLGNGLAGGAGYSQLIKVLLADFNDDGVVDAQDLVGINNALTTPYNIFADVDGDGAVTLNDVNIARNRVGTSLN